MTSIETVLELGEALVEEGKLVEATKAFREVLQAGKHPRAFNGLGVVSFLNGNTGEAAKNFYAALEIDPEFVDARENVELLKRSNRLDPTTVACLKRIESLATSVPPVKPPPASVSPKSVDERLSQLGIEFLDFTIDKDAFESYLQIAKYHRFPDYYQGGAHSNFVEKALEHFIAAYLLKFNERDVYIDVASSDSPTVEIYKELFGPQTYRQDMIFQNGIAGNTIGGDAAAMPIPDGFATKMALHCSFEHFEGDADTRFIRECERVLKPGGKMCIVPFYVAPEFLNQTDERTHHALGRPTFDQDAKPYQKDGWGNRFARFYSPEQFKIRILDNLRCSNITVYKITNATAINPVCYAHYAAVLERAAS